MAERNIGVDDMRGDDPRPACHENFQCSVLQ